MSKYTISYYTPEGDGFELLASVHSDTKKISQPGPKQSEHPEGVVTILKDNRTGLHEAVSCSGNWNLFHRIRLWFLALSAPEEIIAPVEISLTYGGFSDTDDFRAPAGMTTEDAQKFVTDLCGEHFSLICKLNAIDGDSAAARKARSSLFLTECEYQAFLFGKRTYVYYRMVNAGFQPVVRPNTVRLQLR